MEVKKQLDILFLLIGTNPLPNYVSACFLAKKSARLILLHTGSVGKVAENLQEVLLASGQDFDCQQWEIDEADGEKIFNRIEQYIEKYLRPLLDGRQIQVGLNYTGGTKPMAIHARRTFSELCLPVQFSYLDPRRLAMIVEDAGTFPLGTQVTISLDQILKLHGLKRHAAQSRFVEIRAPGASPGQIRLKRHAAQKIMAQSLREEDAWRDWIRNNLRDSCGNWLKPAELKTVILPNQPSLDEITRELAGHAENVQLQEAGAACGFPENNDGIKDFAKWLEGGWLEECVESSLAGVSAQLDLHDLFKGINIFGEQSQFEVDVVALRGYQLFVFSCTTSPVEHMNKSKLFEVFVRSRQMGGDETRFAIVSFAADPAKLQKQLSEEWQAEDMVRVFGKAHLKNLQNEIQAWVQKASIGR